jgi:transposase
MATKRKLRSEILELRNQDKSYREIEKILNCNRSTINYHCRLHNLTDNGKKRYPVSEETKLAVAQYCLEHTCEEASKHFGLAKSTVYKFKNYGKKES